MVKTDRLIVLVFVVFAAGCSGSGGGGGGVMDPPGPAEFMSATVDGAPFQASRVSSTVLSTTGSGTLSVRFFGLDDSSGRMLSFDLEFSSGFSETGSWPLSPDTSKFVRTSNIPDPNDSCISWWNSSITITHHTGSWIEGTFYIEGECTGTQFPPIEFFVQNGDFGICLTPECQAAGWRDTN